MIFLRFGGKSFTLLGARVYFDALNVEIISHQDCLKGHGFFNGAEEELTFRHNLEDLKVMGGCRVSSLIAHAAEKGEGVFLQIKFARLWPSGFIASVRNNTDIQSGEITDGLLLQNPSALQS